MSELSELLQRSNPNQWSTRQIAARAARAGFALGHDTVAKYMRGEHPARPSEPTLRALSSALGVKLEDLRTAAGLPREVTPIALPDEAARLTPRQWDAIREVIRSMVNPGGLSAPSPTAPLERLSKREQMQQLREKAARDEG